MKVANVAVNEYPRSRAARELRGLITLEYAAGEWLPAEHELCSRLSVSRGTLRSAMKDLENEGLLYAQAGRGRMVTTAQRAPAKTMMMDAVAVVTHLPNPSGDVTKRGTDSFIQMSAVNSIARAGLHALMVQPDRLAQDGVERFVAERPRGIVLMRRAVEFHLAREVWVSLIAAEIPVVVYGDVPELGEFDSVVSDHFAGSYQLTNWLLKRGRKRILRVWNLCGDAPSRSRPEWLVRRDAGFEQAMREAGLDPLPYVENRDLLPRMDTQENFQTFTQLAAGQLVPHLIGPNPIDAIMVASDAMLPSVAAACRMFGKEPGKDILLVGYDNYWQDEPTRRWEPAVPAATIDKRNELLGAELVNLLLARASRAVSGPAQHRLIQPELIVPDET